MLVLMKSDCSASIRRRLNASSADQPRSGALWLRATCAAVAATIPAACGGPLARKAVPARLADVVEPLGESGLRAWGDALSDEDIQRIIVTEAPLLRARFGADIAAGQMPQLDFLALSGGGQWGAFGAGLLAAWSESGTRPEFQGVSTRAIIAPFAFLGPEHDETLREIYSQYATKDLVESTVFSGLISGTALADTTLLARAIATYITAELLEEIAAEYRRGRLLFIGSTNLGAGKPVIWNIGAIAASDHPDALDLARSLIRASAAIPVAFPPIFVDVVAPDGTVYDEMHVDGGASSQVTFVSPQLPIAAATRRMFGRNFDRRLWVVVNNDLSPPHDTVRPRLPAIGQATVSSPIRGSGVGDVYRLCAVAQRDDIAFNVTWIPPETPCPAPTEDFDRAFMACLYDFASDWFRSGQAWRDAPPFFATDLPDTLALTGHGVLQ
ncbi:MAG: patatin [Alphaproteobacteria bacterium HGW-Alphaproteobacteria-10]|nr:MAG: patatin [Alphaproteobacteria bacterium HGW-Alphaproteobacteria-10]